MPSLAEIARELARQGEQIARLSRPLASRFPGDPVGYCANVLHVKLTPDQVTIAQALIQHPFRVIVDSAHNIGKTFAAAALCSWWYDTYDPGVVITTAPTERDVVDLLWTEVRLLRSRAGLPDTFCGPRAPEMRTSDDHYAKGYTARKGESFQGRHRARMLFVFDEADGVESAYWTTTKTMFKPELGHAWLAIGNPVSTSSAGALEEQTTDASGNPAWRVINISALDHPNILEQLAGRPAPYPNAVTLPQVDQWVRDWCEPVKEEEHCSTDLYWRGQWLRPGPVAEARMLGRRPSAGMYGLWSLRLWESCLVRQEWSDLSKLPEVGCDVARYGDDYTAFHVRWGNLSLAHETWNGWSEVKVAGRLKHWAQYAAEWINSLRPVQHEPIKPQQIRCKVDDSPVGGGVIDLAGGYSFVGISAARKAIDSEWYPNSRSELWFCTADRAREGRLDLSRLPKDALVRLRHQATAVTWEPNGLGQRVVEKKEVTKDKIGRSPDDMDAMNLAYYDGGGFLAPTLTIDNVDARQRLVPDRTIVRRGLFGR